MRKLVKVADEQEILSILEEFNDVFPHLNEKIDNMESYAKKLTLYSNFYVVQELGKNVGILVFYSNDTDKKTAYLTLIGVKDSLRGKGLGKDLLLFCEEKSKSDGMDKLFLEVDLDNESAMLFYQKNGFCFGDRTDRNSIYLYKSLK